MACVTTGGIESLNSRSPNQLIEETSPYLLQHAYNPVNWYPWGSDALNKAKHEDKPIFLSIGYSACHWCHVMERESFENETIAEFLNDYFVSIKVDREEHPDVDAFVMESVQLMNLNMVLLERFSDMQAALSFCSVFAQWYGVGCFI